MEYTRRAVSAEWPLEEVFQRLKANERVSGLLLIGSLARAELTPASDYDLVIVLRDSPQPWFVGVTSIAGRFSDLIFVDAAKLQAVLDLNAPVEQPHALAPVIRWLSAGKLIFDRADLLARCQQKVQSAEWLLPADSEAAYGAWFALNYNLAVAHRMARTADTTYHTAALIRMAVYGHADVWFGYSAIRGLTWEGDKALVRYLQQQDPRFLDAYQQLISTADLGQKLALYEQAGRLAAEPLGGLWPEPVTVVNVAQERDIWQELVGP